MLLPKFNLGSGKFLILLLLLSSFGCVKDEPDPEMPDNTLPQETITKMVLEFVNADDSTDSPTAAYTISGDSHTATNIELQSNATYYLNISVFDNSDPSDLIDRTPEIVSENTAHRFFFVPQEGAENILSVSYDDFDEDGKPVGLMTTWTLLMGESDPGAEVRIVLKHQSNKTAPGVGINDPEEAGGLTDFSAVFPLVVQP